MISFRIVENPFMLNENEVQEVIDFKTNNRLKDFL